MKLNQESSGYGAVVLTLINLFAQCAQFAFRVALTRLIGPEGMGLYQLVLPVHTVLMSLAVSGFTVAVARLTAEYNARGNTKAVRQLVWQARGLYILILLLIAALVIPLSDAISVHVLGDARTRLPMLILLPVILLTGWENVQKNFFYGMKRVNPPAITEIVEQTVRIGAVLALLTFLQPAYEELRVAMIILGMLISEIASASLLTIFFRRWKARTPAVGRTVPPKDLLREIGGIAVPVAGANVLSNALASANSIVIPGRLILSGLSASQALSAFGVAFGMTMPLLGIPTAFMMAIAFVMMPRIAEHVSQGRWEQAKNAIRRTLLTTTGLLIPASALMCLFGAQIARAVFRQETAGQYMTPMMIATALTCMQYILGSLLNGVGQQRRAAANLIVSGVVELVITWFACAQPDLRLFGFVLAFFISSLLGLGLNLWDILRVMRLHSSHSNHLAGEK